MKNFNNKFILLLAAVFAVGLFFSLRPQISLAAACSSAANLTQIVCSNVCKGTWAQGDFCDCGVNPVNGCVENLSETSCNSYRGTGAVWVPSSCSNCTDQSQSVCATANGSGNSCTNISDPVQCAQTSGCNWNQSTVSCIFGTIPANPTGNPSNPPPITPVTPVTPAPASNPSNPPAVTPINPDCAKMDPPLVSLNGICVPKNNFLPGSIAGSSSLVGLILVVLKYLLILSGLIATVALVVGGFWYITAAGNEEQAEKGQKALTNAIIGMVIIIMAFAIVNILSSTLTTADITKTTGN